jgi:hypothetical protein
MATVCTLIPEESVPGLQRFAFSCVKVPWVPIKVIVCGQGTENPARNFAEGEVENLPAPPAGNLISYCV